MSTAQSLIDKALFVMGASSPMKPAQPEMYQQGLDGLIDMLSRWGNLNTNLGITIPSSLTTEINNPLGTDGAIYYTLAKELCPLFQKALGRDVLDMQARLFEDLLTVYNPLPLPQYPSTLPVGQGNRLSGYDRAYYPQPDFLLDTNGVPILSE
jgi:hypothetical protein